MSTTVFVLIFPDHLSATAVKVLVDLVVKQTSTSVNLIHAKMKEVVLTTLEHFDAFACQVCPFSLSKKIFLFH